MITAIIDWAGDITLSGVHEDDRNQFCINDTDTWLDAGLTPGTEYQVDTVPFEGAKHLLKCTDGKFWQCYTGDEDNAVYFCSNKLKTVFGEVPERIYYKEV